MDNLGEAWTQTTLLGFDTETTGVSPVHSRIATISLITRDKQTGDTSQYWVINPGVPMPSAASSVNGLTNQYLQENGLEPRPVLDQVATQLEESLRQGIPVVGFNVSFDLEILRGELKRHHLPTLEERLGSKIAPIIDPLVLDRHLDRYRKGKRQLALVCAAYGMAPREDFHHAAADVEATLDLLGLMAQKYPQIASLTAGQLHELQVEAHAQWARNFNEFMSQRRPGSFRAASAQWPLNVD